VMLQSMNNKDIIRNIFCFVSGFELALCRRVCKTWNLISQDDRLWQILYLKEFKEEINIHKAHKKWEIPNEENWKDSYKHKWKERLPDLIEEMTQKLSQEFEEKTNQKICLDQSSHLKEHNNLQVLFNEFLPFVDFALSKKIKFDKPLSLGSSNGSKEEYIYISETENLMPQILTSLLPRAVESYIKPSRVWFYGIYSNESKRRCLRTILDCDQAFANYLASLDLSFRITEKPEKISKEPSECARPIDLPSNFTIRSLKKIVGYKKKRKIEDISQI